MMNISMTQHAPTTSATRVTRRGATPPPPFGATSAPFHTRSFSDSSDSDVVTIQSDRSPQSVDAFNVISQPMTYPIAVWPTPAPSPNGSVNIIHGRSGSNLYRGASSGGAALPPPPPPAYAAVPRSHPTAPNHHTAPNVPTGPTASHNVPTPSYNLPPPMLPNVAQATNTSIAARPATASSFGSSPTGGSPLTGSPRPFRHDPYTARRSPPTERSVAHGISHQPLVGRCRFIAWPHKLDQPNQQAATNDAALPRLLIEQVKFEMEAPQLRWLIRELTGVVAVNVVEIERGSFAAYFSNHAGLRSVKALHRAVLFDHSGAWCPSNEEESNAVAYYMSTREFRQRGQRLPRELMVATLRRRSSREGNNTTPNNTNNNRPGSSPSQRGQSQ